MRRLAWGALTGGLLVAAACSSGQPFQDTVDAEVDAAWKLTHGDAGEPSVDAIVLAEPPDASVEAGDTPSAGEGGTGSDATPGGEASTDATAETSSGADAKPTTCTLTSCGTRAVCTAGACVLARRVFVSSTTSTASLGGYAGADSMCQQLAATAGLGGVWMAWISDDNSCPSARFDQGNYEYALLDGTVVASSWKGLTSGTLLHGIDQDEYGHAVPGTNTEVWTATNPDGTLAADGCSSFTSSSKGAPTVQVGVAGNTDGTWTSVYLQFCNRSDHVYCVEQ